MSLILCQIPLVGILAGDSGTMILSSADILRALGADAIIRQEARLSVVEGRPGFDTGDSVYIYVDKYPTIDEFEATWKIWVVDNSGMGEYVLGAMAALLPGFESKGNHYTTTDFASERTVIKTEAEKQLEQLAVERVEYQKGFQGLSETVESRLSNVRDGVDGKDGKDGLQGLPGRDGRDGRDGKDLVATEANLYDLNDVEEGIVLQPGQVLTWDGTKWTNLFVRRSSTVGGGGGGGTSDVQALGDLDDVDTDGVQNGQFLQYEAISGEWKAVSVTPGGVGSCTGVTDGGNVDTGVAVPPDCGTSIAGVTSIIAGAGISVDQADGDVTVSATGGGGSGSGIEEAPLDGDHYVRVSGTWVKLVDALAILGVPTGGDVNGGNFTTGN